MGIIQKTIEGIEAALNAELEEEGIFEKIEIRRLCMTSGGTGGDRWLLAQLDKPSVEFVVLAGTMSGGFGMSKETLKYTAKYRDIEVELSEEISAVLEAFEIGYSVGIGEC